MRGRRGGDMYRGGKSIFSLLSYGTATYCVAQVSMNALDKLNTFRRIPLLIFPIPDIHLLVSLFGYLPQITAHIPCLVLLAYSSTERKSNIVERNVSIDLNLAGTISFHSASRISENS